MNPSVGSTCTGMSASTYYCVSTDSGGIPPSTTDDDSSTGTTTGVSTPSPVQTGIASNCDLFYLVVSEDGCEAIATKYNITLADFYAWNPAVKTDCSGLDANDYVCVGIDASSSATGSSTTTPSTTTSTSTTGTATGIVTPTPTQIGMTTDCDAFYYVVPNDGCYDIAAEYGIALADFYTWNPAVGDDCSGLEPNVSSAPTASAAEILRLLAPALHLATVVHRVDTVDQQQRTAEEAARQNSEIVRRATLA
ncbi:hypothetical protein N0V93_009732 [Gnomoniopsis smithogilvyi]|uniref:LysM domain-containing protein n=1 Tax=Gnomoniopsis smithogilvyi TaxID=1191159 RepID=A0A9W9CU29_9PEZI|nr:hypothetical protein N0V93_009732 [Gnomoniopsis smithogilvyi]